LDLSEKPAGGFSFASERTDRKHPAHGGRRRFGRRPSLAVEEQILIESQQLDESLSAGTESFAESLSYFPDLTHYKIGPEAYLELIERPSRREYSDHRQPQRYLHGRLDQVRQADGTGRADALELNIFFVANDPKLTSEQVEELYTSLVSHVKASVKIPVAVKLAPYFSAMANMAQKLDQAGATAWYCSTAFTSRTSIWKRWT